MAAAPETPGLSDLRRLEDLFALQLSPRQRQQTLRYLELLQKWNRAMNLTSVVGREPILRLHFFESFWVAEQFLQRCHSLADVGTGAGFPGLAAKLYRPRLQLTLIEKSYRKTVFLKEVCRTLGLPATILAEPAEAVSSWERLDVVAFRALRPVPALQKVLSAHRCRLLLLHGPESTQPDPGLFALDRSLPVPGAERRSASLFLPLATT